MELKRRKELEDEEAERNEKAKKEQELMITLQKKIGE